MKRNSVVLLFLFSFICFSSIAQSKKVSIPGRDTVLEYSIIHIPITIFNPKEDAIMVFDLGDLKGVKATVGMVRKINEGNDAKGTYGVILYLHQENKMWYLTDYQIRH